MKVEEMYEDFCFFKQKTAYELRISDWSSDVCSSDLPGASAIPAADSNHPRMATAAGRRIVEMVWADLTPDRIVTPAAIDNAIVVHQAQIGRSSCRERVCWVL